MKRFAVLACISITVLLLTLVLFRGATRRGSRDASSPATLAQIEQRVAEFVDIETEPASPQAFEKAVRDRSQSAMANLTESERDKLIACLSRFYLCYSSGDFNAYARFRLFAPVTISPSVKSAVEQMGHKTEVLSEAEILRVLWDRLNSTNKITSCDLDSISLRVEDRRDLGQSLRRSSTALRDGAFSGAMCWGESVAYRPAAESVLAKEGTLRLFRLELNVRMNDFRAGPATPIVVMGYWDPSQEDWMPLVYCVAFRVADYDTIF